MGFQADACMAVLLQELLVPEISFILHTGGLDRQRTKEGGEDDQRNAPEIYAELAPGLGEILASASMRGSAYRMLVDRETGLLQWFKYLKGDKQKRLQLKSTLREKCPLKAFCGKFIRSVPSERGW